VTAGSREALLAADAWLAAHAPPFPVPLGDHAAAVEGAVAGLGNGDWWVPGLRERAGAVLRGLSVERVRDPWAGSGPYKVAPALPSPAGRALAAVGLALADANKAALVHLGVGSTSDGAFHEALNLAALHRPTVLFLVTVHPLDGRAPLGRQLASSLQALAAAFGIGHAVVDATDATAVAGAVRAARDARGPHLVEARLPASKEHSA
jgi:2-oxoisovalerate dehydrogenase E1 component alpha subunit